MGQKISAPAAVAIVVVVCGGLSLFLYKHFMAGPSGQRAVAFNNTQTKAMQPPHTKEEGLAFYRNAINGGKK